MIAAEFYAIGNEAIKKSHEPSPLMPIYGHSTFTLFDSRK